MKGNAALVKSVLRPGGSLRPEELIAHGGGGGQDGFAVSYDGISLGTTTSYAGFGSIGNYWGFEPTFWNWAFVFGAITGDPVVYGPVYVIAPIPTNCGPEALSTITVAASALAKWLASNAGAAYKALVGFAFDEYAAGEIGAVEFLGACLAGLSAPEVSAGLLTVGAGLTLAAVLAAYWSYLKCVSGG